MMFGGTKLEQSGTAFKIRSENISLVFNILLALICLHMGSVKYALLWQQIVVCPRVCRAETKVEFARAMASSRVFSKTFWKVWTHLPEDILHSLVPWLPIYFLLSWCILYDRSTLCVCVSIFDHVACFSRYFIYRLQVGSLQTLQWLSTILGMIGSMCCEDLFIVNVTLRQPLPKRQKKGGNAAWIFDQRFGKLILWDELLRNLRLLIALTFLSMAEDMPSCHQMKEWNGMKRFCTVWFSTTCNKLFTFGDQEKVDTRLEGGLYVQMYQLQGPASFLGVWCACACAQLCFICIYQ